MTEFFTLASFGTLATATAMVVVSSNTIRRLFSLESLVIPFIISVVVTFAGAAAAGGLQQWTSYLIVFFNSCLLFCTATGAQEALVEGSKPRPADTEEHQARKPVRWLSSWLRRAA